MLEGNKIRSLRLILEYRIHNRKLAWGFENTHEILVCEAPRRLHGCHLPGVLDTLGNDNPTAKNQQSATHEGVLYPLHGGAFFHGINAHKEHENGQNSV